MLPISVLFIMNFKTSTNKVNTKNVLLHLLVAQIPWTKDGRQKNLHELFYG